MARVARRRQGFGILDEMGRGANSEGSSLLYGELAPMRIRQETVEPISSGSDLAIPIGAHPHFKPAFKRLGLGTYVAQPVLDNDGFCGGDFWQALGQEPEAWTRFKSANPAEPWKLAQYRWAREELNRAYAADDTLTCELGEAVKLGDAYWFREVMFGTEKSGWIVDADHFEAMSRVVLASGRNIHDTRFTRRPCGVSCFDEDGTLVGHCFMSRLNPDT